MHSRDISMCSVSERNRLQRNNYRVFMKRSEDATLHETNFPEASGVRPAHLIFFSYIFG